MNFDLSKFKKISENKKSAVMLHPEGHKITIAKHVLSPKLRSKIAELPIHLQSGGDVPSNEDLELEAKSLPKGAGKAEEYALAQDPNFKTNFPDVVPKANEEPVGPPAPTPDDKYNAEVQKRLEYKKQTASQLGSNASEADLLKSAEEEALEDMGSKKQAENKEAENKQKIIEEHYNHDVAYIKSQNAQRQALGLSPLPLPVPTAHISINNAVADAGPSMPGGQPSAQPPRIQPAAQSQPNDQFGSEAYGKNISEGISGMDKGIQGEAEALGQEGKAKANIISEALPQQQALVQKQQELTNHFMDQNEKFMQDYSNKHIDQNRVFQNMSTGRKIGTIIGVLLGGFGALAGQENGALKMLNQEIENDINSQKADMDKGHNLLAANRSAFGDVNTALNMTRANLQSIVANKLDLAAAQAQDPLAKSRALQASAKFKLDSANLISQAGMRQGLMDSMSNQQAPSAGNTDNTAKLINYLRIVNPEMAKSYEDRFVPSVGLAQIRLPDKTREELVTRQNLDNALNDLDKYAEENSGSLNPAVIAEGKSKANLVQDLYRRANGQGVFREAEKEFVGSIIGEDPTKFFKEYRTQPKYKAAIEDNNNQLNGLKKSYGLPVLYKPSSASSYKGNPNNLVSKK